MLLNNNSLIMQWNRDENGNPISWHIPSETQQISPTHGVIQLVQVPDQHYRMKIVTENNVQLTEVFNIQDIAEDSYYVDYGVGIVRFHKSQHGKMVMVSYYGRGVILISDSRIFHRDGENVTDTWENILNRSQDALDLIESAGGLVEAMEKIDEKVSKGEATADRLENFITETQFYGYTINLSREAFVVKAKENGEVSKTELPTVYTDVVVYKGAKQIIPTLSIEQEQGCTFKIEGQRVRLATIDINVIKAGAILNIDCGDGLIAQRTLEVTKVFDGVSQYVVEMTNPFYSFEANSAGSIEKEVTVACDIKVTKANVDYTNYTISVQNAPVGLRYNIGATGVEFTGALGDSLPSHGSCLVVVTIDGVSFNKTFTWNKVRKGEDAKSLVLVGGQIIRYETPDYSDIPSPYRSTVTAKTVGLSGSPKWYVKINETWVLLEGQSGTELTFPHNDATIWGNRKEATVKCSLEGYEDELTLVKLATGTTGADAITVVLTNESHTLAIDNSGQVHESEIAKTKTSVLAFQGTKEVTPVLSKGACEGCDISIDGNLVSLASLDNSFSTATAIINVKVGGVTVPKTWTISKAKQGSDGVSGEDGKSYILNITDGTRSFTYSQINLDPRPSTSSTFVGALYENGVEVLEGVSYYWIANGHLQGSSMNSTFTPTISQTFDESILNNDITLTATYQGNTVVQTIPISITKDANGLDWVQEWDDTKTDVRGNLILTPKLFAGSYDQENDLVTGVAIGKDVLNDGNTIGVAGYQNNKTTFLLDTDGTLMVGNPFEENSTGLYFDGDQFTLKVNQLTIEGSNVATTDDLTTKVDAEINSAKEEIRAEVSDVLMQVDELDSFINSALKDGILDEVERSRIMTLYEALTSEMTDVASQYVSLIGNPYLTNQALLETMEQNFIHYTECYQKLTDILNIIMGNSNDGTESDGTESGGTDNEPEVITDIVLEETPNDEDITVEDNLTAFGNAISDFKEASAMLHKSMSDALTSISEEQANTIVGQAKEEIKKEIDGVSDALGSLETTMNGEFKSGLISTMNLTTLRGKISQLETEKADIDGQYNGIINNPKLGTVSRTNLANAKGELDTAHDQLIIKINSAIADNLMTEAELAEINILIAKYAQALGKYSEIAQQANADIALNLAQGAIEALNQEDIFNKLTNNGETQGIYLENGKVYVNGEYINSRNFKAVRNDGTETMKIDSLGNVHIKANSFHVIGEDTNVSTKEYVDGEIEKISLGNVNIILSNEAQVISTNSNSIPLANQSFAVKVQMYKGASEVTDFTIGTVSGASGISASVAQSTKTVTFSVSTSTTISAVSGKITIPITYNDKTYNKEWSWAIAKQGNTGATGSVGASAPHVVVNGEQVFKYTNNFSGTPTPSSITLTATKVNTSASGKWQWFNGSTWTDWSSDSTVLTSTTLSVSPTAGSLNTGKSIRIRYLVGSVYDEITIVKVSDGAQGATGSAGKGVSSITNYYLASSSSSGVTTSTSGWTTGIQNTTTTNKYLWNYEVIRYTDNSTTNTTPVIIGTHGATGSAGKGISSITEYYLATASASGVTTSTSGWTTTVQTPTSSKKYLWNYEVVTYTDSTKYTGTPRIIGNYAQDGSAGADAITIVLTNENHTFSANSSGNITSAQSTSTNILAYKGASAIAVTIGTLPTVTGLTLSKSGSTVTIQANAGTSLADTGTLSIPLTADGKSFTKNFSWTKVKAGATGATGSAGTNAKAVDIIASSQVFKSADGGKTFSPSTITLTPKLQNLTYSNWQYSTNGGSSWTAVTSGSNGLTISSGVLTISKDSALYTSSVTSVAFRVNTNDSAYYDVTTIVKLYDVGELEIGGRNLVKNSPTLNNQFNQLNTYKGTRTVVDDATAKSGKHVKFECTTAGTGFYVSVWSGDDTCIGKQYTWSFYAKMNVAKTLAGIGHERGGRKDIKVTTEWQKFTHTWTYSSSGNRAFVFYPNFEVGDVFYIRDFKIEEGNRATDYTVAPEDVDSSIQGAITTSKEYTNSQIKSTKDAIELSVSSTYETKTNVSSQISSTLTSAKSYADTKKTEAINSANTTLNNTIANYYTKTQTDSAIKVAKDAIDLSVKNTYETKTEVSNKISAVQVGGTNLVQNSDFSKGTSKWSSVSPWGIHSTTTYSGKKVCYISRSGLTSDSWAELKSNNISCKQGEIYTMSVDIKTSGLVASTDTATVFIWSYDANGGSRRDVASYALPTSTDWVRYKCTGTIPSGSTIVRACITVKRNGTVYATNFKLEKGNKATEWSPAPEDVNSSISSAITESKSYADSQIKIAKDAITSSVSSTYETKTNVNAIKNQINQAKQNIRCNDLGAKINYSAFATSNAGEIYLHGYDSNNNPTDTNGKIYWNGATLTVVKGMINPDSNFPFNTDVYIFVNKNSSGSYVYGMYYNTSTKAWAYKQLIGGTDANTNYTPNQDHIALGVFNMTSAEAFNHAYLFETPQSLTQLTVGSENLTSRMNTAEQKITDSAIVSTVTSSKTYTDAMTGKVSKTEIISSINQTAESVKINASKIALTGDVVVNAINGGSTLINGSKITTGTITAEKIAVGDFTNYAQLNDNTASLYGFTKGSNEASGAWLTRNSMARDILISDYHTCNGGETFRLKGDISTTIKGSSTNGGTDSTYRGTAIGLFVYDGTGATINWLYGTRVSNATQTVSSTITLPANARKFRVYIQTEGWGNWSGTLKVRNIQVTKMINSELIVNGAITANMITSGTFQGTNFIAGGSSNGNGYIQVKDASNVSTFYANKNGVKAKEIQFLENPNGGSTNINTIIQKEGMSITYDLPQDPMWGSFTNSTQYNFYGITMAKRAYDPNYSIEATSDINAFGSMYKRKGTGREDGLSGSAMFGLADGGKGTGSYCVPAIVYNDGSGSGFVIATSVAENLKTYNNSWSGTGKVFQVDTNGTTCVRNLKIMGGYDNTLLSSTSDGSRLKIQTYFGNAVIGPYNSEWCHFSTDRAKFWFEKAVHVCGEIYAGSGYNQRVYHTGYKPSPADIGAARALVSSGGYQGLTLNDGSTSGWVRTTVSGLIPSTSTGANWVSSSSSLGTSSWRFGNGYIKEMYCNGLTNDLGDLWLTAKAGANTIYTQAKWVCPPNNSTTYLGASGYRWHSVWSANGTIQTSDERFKIKRGFANVDDCFEMVRGVQLYKYTMLNENKESLTRNQLGKMAMECEKDNAKVHIGIMAQDLQQYECGKQILVESEYEKEDGIQDTMLNVNPYDMTMAVMGALKKEIQIRETENQKLTEEVETLRSEIEELKAMVQQLLILK